jgi:hypothetical protein
MLNIDTAKHAAPGTDPQERLHRRLAAFNRDRLNASLPDEAAPDAVAAEAEQRTLERRLVDGARAEIAARAATAPRDPDGFVAWFEDLKESGPGQNDPLFPWLADSASLAEMRWFLQQEVAGEAGFDDLLALTQLKMPLRAKLEMARNYWDEMGRGNAKGVHGSMLVTLAEAFEIDHGQDEVVWQALALGNMMLALASNRCYAYHAIGALGVIELTAPSRAVFVARGLKRLGIPAGQRHYFDLHAVLDVSHSAAWNQEVLKPLIAEMPRAATAIAEGALLRLRCGELCFKRYRRRLRIDGSQIPRAARH